jgi:hypothetical protein
VPWTEQYSGFGACAGTSATDAIDTYGTSKPDTFDTAHIDDAADPACGKSIDPVDRHASMASLGCCLWCPFMNSLDLAIEKARKACFFEKKKQETLAQLASAFPQRLSLNL